MKYNIYFLQSLKDNKYYIGCTSKDPLRRLSEHNLGKVTSTRRRTPFKLVYQEQYLDKKSAFKREWYLKHPAGYQDKLKIIRNIINSGQ